MDERVTDARRLAAIMFTDMVGYSALEARAAVADARRVHPNLSIETIERAHGVSRPEVDARRNAAWRKAGLE